ncbi:MAG: hypothetical protein LBC65_01355 [Oscillospiraceae bacterium]|jgi:hypothetical protein|nr:hypothetical protein [Oscillospiraceae bacterium]
MDYPSLIYSHGAIDGVIAAEVFEDLKLDLLLTPSLIAALSSQCPESDISARQAAYASIAADSAGYETLLQIVSSAESLYRFYIDADSEVERDYAFAHICGLNSRFARLAAIAPGGDALVSRFRESFSAMVDSLEFRERDAQLERVLPLAKRVATVRFVMRGDNLKLNLDDGAPSLAERIYRSAADLELGITQELSNPAMRLNARIYSAIAQLSPVEFTALREFYERFGDGFDPAILRYALELNFYLEPLRLLGRAAEAGMSVTLPAICEELRFRASGLCDLSLLSKSAHTEIVGNDVFLTPEEPFFFLSGANGGGKTTYLRSVGIAALFARSGLPVTAESATLCAYSAIHTHFPRDEQGESRLAEERRRVDAILGHLPAKSLVLLNETYSTTTYEKSSQLTAQLSARLSESGSHSIYITHQLSAADSALPLLTVSVDSENRRTYRVVRADSRTSSYASDILRKYGLSREELENSKIVDCD